MRRLVQLFGCFLIYYSNAQLGFCQSRSDVVGDSLRALATAATDAATRSDHWLSLSKHYRKSNLDSTQALLIRATQAAKASGDRDRQQRCNMSQAALSWMQGDLENAEKRYLQAISYWKGKNDTVEVTRCLLNLGTVCQSAFKNEEAAKYLKTSLKFAQQTDQQLIAAQAAGSVSSVYFQMNEPDSVRKFSEIARQGFESLNDSSNLARVHCNLGLYYKQLGMSYEARQPYARALDYLTGSKDIGLLGEIHDGFGGLEYNIGNLEEAIDHFVIAGECFQKMKWYLKIAKINNTIGLCLRTLGRDRAAQALFQESYRLSDSIKDYATASAALSNLAAIDRDAGRNSVAVNKYRKAIQLDLLAPTPSDLFSKYIGLGQCHAALGARDSADHYLELALADARKRNQIGQIAECHLQKTKRNMADKAYSTALSTLDSSQHWYLKIRDPKGMQEVFMLRSRCQEALGDYLAALSSQRTASQWQDSVLSISSNTQLLALEAKFWSEKKQHALELAKQNESLQAKEAERANEASARLAAQRNLLFTGLALTLFFSGVVYWLNAKRRKTQLHRKLAEMRMTALRAQMNPHFIFNALGSVQLLINTSAIREANLYLSKFAQLLRITLERSETEGSTLEDEIEALKLYIDLEALRFKFQYSIEVDEAIQADKVQFPTLLLQPIVENAVKHGLAPKANEGKLKLRFDLVGKALRCTIEDNGVGRGNAKKSKHENSESRKSFGIQIARERLQLINSTRIDPLKIVDLTDANGKSAGTLVEITLPVIHL
jgi:tetratricopeptide (TPR) repeat protein